MEDIKDTKHRSDGAQQEAPAKNPNKDIIQSIRTVQAPQNKNDKQKAQTTEAPTPIGAVAPTAAGGKLIHMDPVSHNNTPLCNLLLCFVIHSWQL